jgi:hypothetical protein
MKTSHIILLLIFTLTLSAQNVVMPSLIKSSFKKAFPDALDLNWAENNGKYEIEFYLGPEMYTAVYDVNGILLETAVIIPDDQIPEKLLSEIARRHPEAGLAYAEKVTTAGVEKFLRVVTESENMVYTVIARLDGTIIRIDEQNYNTNNADDNEDVE